MLLWLKNAPIGVKVALAPAVGVVCLAFVGTVGWYVSGKLGETLALLSDERLPRVTRINTLEKEVNRLNALVNQSLAWEGAGFKAEKIEALDKQINTELKRIEGLIAELGADNSLDDEEKTSARQLMADYAKFRKSSGEALDIKAGMLANAASFMTTMEATYVSLKLNFEKLLAYEQRRATESAEAGRKLSTLNRLMVVGGCLLAALLSSLVGWLIARLIVHPLREACRLAKAMSIGDFTLEAVPAMASADATGQVLQSLGDVSDNLGTIVQRIRLSAEAVSLASNEIATGNLDLSSRTESTASSLQAAAASLHELTVTIQQSADQASYANNLVRDAQQAAAEGGAVVADVISTMHNIDAHSKQIREIISVIDGIAFQTNILALNAAVEAARAGEQGRGFSVVAAEVRMLAQRSADASTEIRTLIGNSVGEVEAGTSKVTTAGVTMERIVGSIHLVSNTMEGISLAMREQASGVAQVNDVMAEMDRTTQQNAALVEQSTAATESLNTQAKDLADAIGKLRTLSE